MNKKTGLREGERKSIARLVEELRAARRKIAVLERAKSALEVDEEHYRLIFENSSDAILLAQPDGTISAANPEACRMFGRSEKEIKKLGKAGIVDSKEPLIAAAIKEKQETGQFKGELNHVKKNGVVFPCDVRMKIFKDSSGRKRTIIILRDLTDRRRAEEALREREKELRVLFEQLPIGVTLLDQNRKIIYVNPALEKILDISRDDLLKGKYQNRRYLRPNGTSMPPEEYASVRAFQNQQPVHDAETGVITESGKTIWMSVSATPFPIAGKGVVIATVDVTERKRAEEALQFTRVSLDNAADSMACVGRDARFVEVNKAFCRNVGYSREELLSMTVHDLDPNYQAETWSGFWERLKQAGSLTFESRHYTKHGRVVPVEIVATFFEYNGREYHCSIARDITERKQAEETLRKSQSNLRALARKLSHAEERERQRLALFLHDEIGQTLALLRIKFGGLTDAWKSKSGKQSIRQIRDLLEKAIDQTHTLTFELSPPILHQLGLEAAIEWAGEKVSQENAIEFIFSDDGRTKPLDTELKALLFGCVRELMMNIVKHAKARRMTVSLTRTEERLFIVVEDDGIGFDALLLERQPDIVGFGLFSIRERLAAVDGALELRSEPGRGTRIMLSVPVKEETPSG